MKRHLLIILILLLPMVANANAVEINGIYYNLVSKIKTAEVISNPNEYKGVVNIPKSVYYDGDAYIVTSIGEDAFRGCNKLTSITIPNSVTSIGNNAFYNISGLTSVTIPNSVTSIGKNAFMNCYHLTTVIIPNSVTSIGEYAFSQCYHLISVTIPNSLAEIGNNIFSNCGCLTSVTIPNTVTSIGNSVFFGCSSLKSVTIPNSVTSIGNSVFYGCTSLTSVTIGNGVTCIGTSVFKNCNKLVYVTIGNNVTAIGNSVFSGCSSLASVIIPEYVTSIGENAFQDCSSLKSVTIPKSVTSISNSAFFGCSGLTSVTIGSRVTSIEYGAFANCPELTDVYSYAKNVPQTHNDAFERSFIEYATLHVPAGSVNFYKTSSPWSGFGTIVPLDGEIEDDICIDDIYYNFSGNNAEVTFGENPYSGVVIIPTSVNYNGRTYIVTSIGSNAFYRCFGLTSVSIPNSMTTIGNSAFCNCSSLTDVYCYAENVPETNENAFEGSNITSATLHVPKGSMESYRLTLPWSNFGRIVSIGDDIITPVNGVYQLATAKDLEQYSKIVNEGENYAKAILTKDINLSEVITDDSWTSIGNSATPFMGTFDGQGHTIRGITFTAKGSNNGLFGVISTGAVVKNFTAEGIYTIPTTGYDVRPAAPIIAVAQDNSVLISNIVSKVDINNKKVTAQVGGILGASMNGTITIERCTYSGTLDGNDDGSDGNYGGIVGYVKNNSAAILNINNCLFDGQVINTNTSPGGCTFGGLVGYSNKGLVTIKNCLSIGIVQSAVKGQFFGAIKNSQSRIINSYYLGNAANGSTSTVNLPANQTDEKKLANGEVCYKLNGDQTEINWYQTLGTDENPLLSSDHRIVYPVNHLHCDGTPYEDTDCYSNDSNTTLKDAHNFVNGYCSYCDTADENAGIGTTVDIVISNAGYSTFFDSHHAYELPKALIAQVITDESNGKLTYKTIADGSTSGILPMGTAVMLVSDEKRSETFTLISVKSDVSYSGKNLLHGSNNATITTGDGYHYKLSYGQTGTKWDDVFGWYWGAQNGAPFQIEGHKAWLVIPEGSTRAAGYTINGDATEIIDIESEEDRCDVYYDIQGRLISSPRNKGLYIKNGKKVVVK